MLKSQREQLAAALLESLNRLAKSLDRPLELDQAMVMESLDKPRQAEHGDIASNIALRLAKPLAMPPAKIGQAIADSLRADAQLQAVCEEISVAGPGFINLRLRPAARASVLTEIARSPRSFGFVPIDADGPHVLIEFVSANPTGPLHVGHGRQAALGDSLAGMLANLQVQPNS